MADGVVPVHISGTLVNAMGCQYAAKMELVQKLKGGLIVEVNDAEEAKIAVEAGACSIVIQHGTPHMPTPDLIKQIKRAVSIPIMARVRAGHFVEAQILEAIGVDYVDESQLLGTADGHNYINKNNFYVPFACRCEILKDVLMRVNEGAAIIWMQGGRTGFSSFWSGDIVDTVRIVKSVKRMIRQLINADEEEVLTFSRNMAVPYGEEVSTYSRNMVVPYDLLVQIKQIGRLPALQFAAGGIETPADAAFMMQLGCDGVYVGSEIFNCLDPLKQVRAMVQAVKHYNDPHVLAEISSGFEDVGPEDDTGFIPYLV